MLSIIKIYNFRVDFTDCFTATVEFEKNYDLFNLKFSCIKEKQIFADAAAVTACTANYRPDPFDLLNANIEALAQDESLAPRESYSGKYGISSVEQLSFAVCPAMNHVRAHALLQALVVEQRLHLH